MEKKPKGLLPKVELIIIGIFLASFLIWAYSKCSNKRQELATETSDEELATTTNTDTTTTDELVGPTVAPPATLEKSFKAERYTKLFVTIDELNLRVKPDLGSEILVKLPLDEEVYFMNEVTDSSYQINLGDFIADEPYIKVRTKKGHIGWVYGAGVNYYRR